MSKLKLFRVVLQRDIDPEVTSWDYFMANLPQAKQTNAAGLIKCLSLSPSEASQQIVLRLEQTPQSRVIHNESLDKLLLLSASGFRLQWPAKLRGGPKRSATGKEHGDFLTQLASY
ncbi:hypothetical protein P171DRAFT_483843 [Karstenula rhodostoma CBS 690.94]|uniref:Uncharacterized protein n=1 Tax=Karstenula rhodostoma CBS 690.94 TaxID=1392251 RepID=A0A9P4PP87_9PLEO|nr:hypothetical protein P171DRAFT_483843 [Karstenula rhodostoma CBS 690.94]